MNSSKLMALTHVSLLVRMARTIAVLAQMRLRKKGAASGVVDQDSRPCDAREVISKSPWE